MANPNIIMCVPNYTSLKLNFDSPNTVSDTIMSSFICMPFTW